METEEKETIKSEGKLRNATPHSLHIYDPQGKKLLLELEQPKFYIRMKSEKQKFQHQIEIEGKKIDVYDEQKFTGLMDQDGKDLDFNDLFSDGKDDVYIVAWPVIDHVRKNHPEYANRFYMVDTGPEGGVRDTGGRLKGTRRLIQ